MLIICGWPNDIVSILFPPLINLPRFVPLSVSLFLSQHWQLFIDAFVVVAMSHTHFTTTTIIPLQSFDARCFDALSKLFTVHAAFPVKQLPHCHLAGSGSRPLGLEKKLLLPHSVFADTPPPSSFVSIHHVRAHCDKWPIQLTLFRCVCVCCRLASIVFYYGCGRIWLGQTGTVYRVSQLQTEFGCAQVYSLSNRDFQLSLFKSNYKNVSQFEPVDYPPHTHAAIQWWMAVPPIDQLTHVLRAVVHPFCFFTLLFRISFFTFNSIITITTRFTFRIWNPQNFLLSLARDNPISSINPRPFLPGCGDLRSCLDVTHIGGGLWRRINNQISDEWRNMFAVRVQAVWLHLNHSRAR